MKRPFIFIFFMVLVMSLSAQTKQIQDLQQRHKALQRQIAETERLLKTTRKDVRGQLYHLQALMGQIEERQRYIESMNKDVKNIDGQVTTLSSQLQVLEKNLNDAKQKYLSSVYYVYKNKTIQEKLMFIFSAKSLSQMYRRLRYVKEYATYQKIQGEEIEKRQALVTNHRYKLVKVKQVKVGIVKERETEKSILEQQEAQKKVAVNNLQKKQRSLQGVISKKRSEANQLNARIDRLITMEIEKARRRAEAEARRRQEELAKKAAAEAMARKLEAQRRAEEKRRIEEDKTKSIAEKTAAINAIKREEAKSAAEVKTSEERMTVSTVDRQLSENFESNRGRLPVPITGSYIIISHYGQYAVEGMKNVKLDNKGIDIQGHPGACARAIFSGEVSAVFQMNGMVNILIRHGEYISVYCNLASASVSQGQRVSTRQILGRVFSDASDGNRTVLHFQLRKERSKLNPEQWIGR
jgi:septal ring factor EnvC (AmiA/AmiB activator)